MKKLLYLCIGLIFITSCLSKRKSQNADRFKKGVFEIPAGRGYSKTIVIRKDSLQIERYSQLVEISTDSGFFEQKRHRTDTLFIRWKNNFAYTLRMKSPKKAIDKEVIHVQINRVTDSSYNFTATIGYSNFKQTGVIYKKLLLSGKK